MEILQSLIALMGVIIGAVLSGIGFYLKARLERKRTIALALTDLLEVRHHITGIDVVLGEIKKRFEIPAEATLLFQTMIDQISPIEVDVHKRYESAITLLAGIDPLLAFQLRSKNTLPNVLANLRGIGESTGVSKEFIVDFENTLRLSLAPRLDEAVIELAGKHSIITKIKVKKLIADSKEVPSELNIIFEQIEKMDLQSSLKDSHVI